MPVVWVVSILPLSFLLYNYVDLAPSWSLAHFTSYLAAVVRRNLPLGHAIAAYAKDLPGTRGGKRRVLLIVAEAVDNGMFLADAMALRPGIFPGYYRSLVSAGESGGNLARVLGRLGETAELDSREARRAAGHASYPAFLALMAFGAMALVMPCVGRIFEVVWVTRPGGVSGLPFLRMGALARITALAVVVVFGGIAFFALARHGVGGRFRRLTPAFGRAWSHLVWYLPGIAGAERRRAVSQYALAAGQLMEAGVPTHEALSIAAAASGNDRFEAIARAAALRVAEGEKMSSALRSADPRGELPHELLWYVEVGERSGKLPEALARVSESAWARSRTALTHLVGLVLPAGVVLAALAIGLMVYGVFGSISAIQGAMH